MTDKKRLVLSLVFFLILFSTLLIFLRLFVFWVARSNKVVFAGESGGKQSAEADAKMALSLDGALDSPAVAGQKSNPIGPGASADLAASTRPNGDWKITTAYSLDEEQTDLSPTIGAWGDDLAELQRQGVQVCASNEFKRGTKLLVGDTECVVMDKMAKRFGQRVDWLMPNRKSAINFGVKKLEVLIVAK